MYHHLNVKYSYIFISLISIHLGLIQKKQKEGQTIGPLELFIEERHHAELFFDIKKPQ